MVSFPKHAAQASGYSPIYANPCIFNNGIHLYINLAYLSVCLFVCLYPINVKTAEPIGSKFCVGPDVVLGKVYEWSKFKSLCLKVLYFYKFLKILTIREFFLWNPRKNSISNKFSKSTKLFYEIRDFFVCFCFKMYTKRTCSQFK